MNTYTTHDGKHFVRDASGKEWECNVAHGVPLPEGIISASDIGFCYVIFSVGDRWHTSRDYNTKYWLCRNPTPPVPRIKTQAEKDEEWITATLIRNEHFPASPTKLLAEAIAYARSGPQCGQEIRP